MTHGQRQQVGEDECGGGGGQGRGRAVGKNEISVVEQH